MSYAVKNVYTALNSIYNFKLTKVINKLKIFKYTNLILFIIKLKITKNFKVLKKFSNIQLNSKLILCLPYLRFKTFFCSLSKLQKKVLKRKYGKHKIKHWLIDKYNFNYIFNKTFTDLIVYYYFLLILVLKNLCFINFLAF